MLWVLLLNECKRKFGSQAIEDLYQRWKTDQLSDLVRTEYAKVKTPKEVGFTPD